MLHDRRAPVPGGAFFFTVVTTGRFERGDGAVGRRTVTLKSGTGCLAYDSLDRFQSPAGRPLEEFVDWFAGADDADRTAAVVLVVRV